ncbi:NAD(P)-dependent oxidoreductase [Saccharospirillum mangrovi]|uniref:NAD(P)-dependent oxidoreductase n=1 Tax=Saccharospirillum mangrovi TaxID=2161747 RepID=UPI000D39C989|nr:DUF1932 domain-containing protein [Saccharospirillum mangrovi]
MSQHAFQLAFIGFGEAAEAFSSGVSRRLVSRLTAFDLKANSADAAVREALAARCQAQNVIACDALAEAINNADLVWSLVTADQAHAAAEAAAPLLKPGALFLDANSCAPQTKQRSARLVEQAGGRYVDVAVMAPVLPSRHRTPLLVSGDHAAAALDTLQALDMNAREQVGPVGRASSVKMVRSIMVKGLEALTAECVLAGRLAGVDDDVLASLNATHGGSHNSADWADRSAYNLERMLQHGERRAAEMTEVSLFLTELGMAQPLSERTAQWQRRLGELQLASAAHEDYRLTADALIAALNLKPLTED